MTEVTKEFIQKNEDEKIIEIEIERLRSFKNHPFQVKDDNEMHLLKESIEKYGILTPLIVRPVPDLEDVLMHVIRVKFIRPSVRKYETENYYESDPDGEDQKTMRKEERKGGKSGGKKKGRK